MKITRIGVAIATTLALVGCGSAEPAAEQVAPEPTSDEVYVCESVGRENELVAGLQALDAAPGGVTGADAINISLGLPGLVGVLLTLRQNDDLSPDVQVAFEDLLGEAQRAKAQFELNGTLDPDPLLESIEEFHGECEAVGASTGLSF